MKTSITLLLILFTSIISGQDDKEQFSIEKGTWSIEADFSINSRNNDFFNPTFSSDSKFFNFSVSPKIGYAISKNLILGLGLGYGYSKSEDENENQQILRTTTSTSNSFGISPFVKKFFPISEKVAFHLQGETRFAFGKNTFENSDNSERESRNESFFVGIRPGINLSLTKNILLQANFGSFGYNYISGEVDDIQSQETNSLSFNLGSSSFIFGMIILL
ncbi:hypothetical protein pgond44_07210 [Psychroflexus gondwanensis ACAM 44]|jgi:hypothetical protein|uniref:Uncharacterized protein n=1 Tax=Psychroflexus gondwanensis ACAM 44 TaxID=1189619 RepID=N1WMV3_9FLAO|nr:outer membrane beta-barrel protein [Psychroflexus gondwanensis]EMY81621.1 hypothetical protein pgond44_07210 [Psychroflexus gondwanensis ACAM 44]